MAAAKKKELTFEQSDEMVKLYEEGMTLTDYCRKLLEGYEGRLMQVNAGMQIEEIQE